MTEKDRIFLFHFICRTPMYVGIADERTISSFIIGYEVGRAGKCNFRSLMRQHFLEKLSDKNEYLGLPDLIAKFAKKKSQNWVIVFKQESLEILGSAKNTRSNKKFQKLYKERVLRLIGNIGGDPNYSFNSDWITHWSVFCSSKSIWFKALWTEEQFKAINAISREINKANFKAVQPLKVSKGLLKQKSVFQNLLS